MRPAGCRGGAGAGHRERRVACLYVGDDAFTVETFKEAFAKAEDAAPIAECAKKYTRGAVIGGRIAKVFKPSEGAGDNWKVNKLLSELKKTGIVTAKKEEKIELVVEGHSRMFTKVVCYEASPQAAHLVVQMTEDSEWATPEAELVRMGNKRKREHGESSEGAQES